MATEAQIFQVEEAMEVEFLRILSAEFPHAYRTRSRLDVQTPWVEVMFLVGKVNERHEHILSEDGSIFDAWTDSQLEVRVVTHRQSNGNEHASICGKVRALLQRHKLCPGPRGRYAQTPNWQNNVHILMDLREAGTTYSIDEEEDLDTSLMTFSANHGIAQSAWE